jgi:prepilin-type N-terminal cleavage/methylation domain-containing protein
MKLRQRIFGRRLTPKKSSSGGFTLVELIITITVMAVMILTVAPLFDVTSRGYTALEVNTVLSAGMQEALTHIQSRLSENKRLFGRDATGLAFLGCVTPNVSPAPLTGSLLPVIASTGSLTPSGSAFASTNTGNSLLFASVDNTVDISTTNGGASTSIQRMDTYVFNYYYLAPNTTLTIRTYQARDLWEWHSVAYPDYQNLINITDTTLQRNVVKALLAKGFGYAFDPSVGAVNSAFYQLTSAGALNAASPHNIIMAKSQKMINLIRGISLGSFVYSVSPNTGGSLTHKYIVPIYATANGNFPSGLEIEVVGPSSNRRVFGRLVMAAQGNFKGILAYEQVMLVSARDLY